MLRLRIFSLLLILLIIVGPVGAAPSAAVTNVNANNGIIHGLADDAYFNTVIVPAKNSHQGMSADQAAYYWGYMANLANRGANEPGRDRHAGPDNAGYYWRDNGQGEAGVQYSFIDATQNGRNIGAGDDWNSGVLNLGWNFPWYGNNYSSIRVCSNGWITFDANYAGGDIGLPQCPNATAPNALIAVMDRDLDPSAGGAVYFYTNNQNEAVIEWADVPSYGDANTRGTFEIVLTANGMAKLQYSRLANMNGANANIGFESPDGRNGLNINYYTANFLSQGLAIGIAQRFIQYAHAGIDISPAALNFGNVYLGVDGRIVATVTNVGAEQLDISRLACDDGRFILPDIGDGVSLASGEAVQVPVYFRPNASGQVSADIIVTSNAENAQDGVTVVRASGVGVARPSMVIEEQSFDDELNTGETSDHVIHLSNPGESVLNWTTELTIIQEPGDRDNAGRALRGVNGAPERDNPGDLIAQFQGINAQNQYCSPIGWDWDNERMWVTNYSSASAASYSIEGNYANFVRQVQINPGNCMDGCWIDGFAWIPTLGNSVINKYNAAGQNVGNVNIGFGVYGLAADVENEHLFVLSSNDWYIHVFNLDGNGNIVGNQIGQIQNHLQFHGNQEIYGLEWVPKHPDGQLWMNTYSDGITHEIAVNEANWSCTGQVQQWRAFPAAEQPYVSVAHDGHNMWAAGYTAANIRVYDDGISEAYWFLWTPEEGAIQPGAAAEVTATLDAADLIEGTYEADLHFLSNDPVNPNVAVNFNMFVHGVPAVLVEWPAAIGFPNEIDWNRAHADLFTGVANDVVVKVTNDGTAELVVDGIECNNGYFTAGPQQFVLGPDEFRNVTFTLAAQEDGDHRGTMTLFTNDPDNNGEVSIAVRGITNSPPQISINPGSIEEDLFTGGSVNTDVTVSNTGGAPLRFSIEHEVIREGGRDANARTLRGVDGQNGPARDNPGDLIAQFGGNVNGANQYSSCVGWDWDNERMWVSNYSTATAAAYTHDAGYQNFREVIRIQPGNCMDGAWADGLLFLGTWSNAIVNRYNTAGQNIGAIQFPFSVYGIAADVENEHLFVLSGNDQQIKVFNLDGNGNVNVNQPIGSINNHMQFHNNMQAYGLDWVPKHPDGQLWMTSYSTLRLYQIAVNEANWTCTGSPQNWQYSPGQEQPYCSVAHDGHNMWASGYGPATIRVYDDGVSEAYWLLENPTEGEVAGGESANVVVGLDATGLDAGDYEADVHFLSNDPRNANVTMNVLLHVQGAPDITVEWAAAAGFAENLLDFNRVNQDVFAGGPYRQNITITNDGTADLDVQDIYCNLPNQFTAAPTDFVLSPDEARQVVITFNAAAAGNYSGVFTIESDDPDEDPFEFNVHAQAFSPPELNLESQAIEDDLFTGQTRDYTINMMNGGDALLRYSIEAEILGEGGRDATSRTLRGVDGQNGPARDRAGDLLGQFQGINNANQYCSPIGWDWDNEMMWVSNYITANAAAYTHDANYANFQEVVRANTGSCMDGCWADGFMWLGNFGSSAVNRYNAAGQNVGAVNFPFAVYGLGWDRENEWLFALSGNDWQIHVFQLDGNGNIQGGQIGAIANHQQYHANQTVYGMEWVGKHPDGQLWMTSPQDMKVHQIAVDTDNWTCTGEVQNFNVFPAADQPYSSVAHDGKNLWASGYNAANIRVYDDGVTEMYWLMYTPTEGTLESGAHTDLAITINAAGLFTGDYSASLHVLSNDPASPDTEISILIHVTGAPDIMVEWNEAWGYNEEVPANSIVDWNRAFQDVFAGGPYRLPLDVTNSGTEELSVSEVFSDNGEEFTPDVEDFVLAAGETRQVVVTFNAAEPGDYSCNMVFVSDAAGDHARYLVPCHARAFSPPNLELDTQAIEDELHTGEVREYTVNMMNTGDALLRYSIEAEILGEAVGGRDASSRTLRGVDGNVGALRDDPGELIAQFGNNVNGANQYSSCVGWDWDNERMWVSNYSNASAAAYTHDNSYENFQEVIRINPGNCMDGCWADGYLFLGNWANAAVNRYNAAGQNIGAIQFPFAVYGIAADVENEHLFVLSGNDNIIRVFDLDGAGNVNVNNPIGQINNHQQYHNNMTAYGLEWVPKHPAGQLWMTDYNALRVHQIAVDEDNWTCTGDVQNWQYSPGQEQPYCSVAHDGHNMWASGYGPATIRVYDDGVSEMYWLMYAPTEGTLESGADTDITITINAAGLLGGLYTASLHILSNDPDNPDAEISINITVIPVPNIAVEWEESAGFPDVIDFNAAYSDLFTGGPYEIPVNVINSGTEDLSVDDIVCDNENFAIDPIQFVLGHGETQVVVVTLNAPEDGENRGTITISSNAGNFPEWQIGVTGTTSAPPTMVISPESIREELVTGETVEDPINVSNEGTAQLNWDTDVEIISEPGRDANGRHLRGVDGNNGPRRDEAGELLGQFAGINQANQYCSPIGWDWDNEVMWVTNYSQASAAAYSHSNDYQEFQEVVRINPGNCMDGCWIGGVAWIPTLGNSSINKYNAAGQNVGAVNVGFGVYGMAADVENNRLFIISSNDMMIHVFQLDDNFAIQGGELGVIRNYLQFNGNQQVYGIEWVPKHPEGQLWVNSYSNGLTHQIAVDEANWTCTAEVQNFQAFPANEQPYISVAHDRNNLWAGGYTANNIRVYDDGVFEAYWLVYSPTEGSLAQGQDQDVIVTLNAAGLVGGDYIADLGFNSNDPANRRQLVRITLNVTGIPNIDVTPGGPEEGEAAANMGIAYVGYTKSLDLALENVGTDELTVSDWSSNLQQYSVDDNAFPLVLGIGEATTLRLLLTADEPRAFDATITLTSDDPRYAEGYPIRVEATGLRAPNLDLSVNSINEDLVTGETADDVVNVANNGASQLNWTTDAEIIAEPGDRDAANRHLRAVPGAARAEISASQSFSIHAAVVPTTDASWNALQANDARGNHNVGPRRDELESVFAYFKESDGWGNIEAIWEAAGANMTMFSSNDMADFAIDDYDVIWIREYQSDQFNNNWNNSRARFEDWIDNGGVLYHATATNNWGVLPVSPGGLERINQNVGNGTVVVSGDPDADNYNYLADLMDWNGGENLPGSSWEHANYAINDIANLDNSDYYQVIAEPQGMQDKAGVAVYNYGRGWVVVSGTTDSHQFANYRQAGNWGLAVEQLPAYFDFLAHISTWITWAPEEGSLAAGADEDVTVSLTAVDMVGGQYIADLHFFSNDPADPDQVVEITMNVEGAPAWGSEPIATPFDGAEGVMFDATYVGATSSIPVVVSNTGTDNLIVDGITVANGNNFGTDLAGDANIAPGDNLAFNLLFHPAGVGQLGGRVTISTNARNTPDGGEEGTVWFNMVGVGMTPPGIYTRPENEVPMVNLQPNNQTEDVRLVVGNSAGDGGADLVYEISAQPVENRDANARALRSVDGQATPRRDPDPRYLLIQQGNPWGYNIETFFRAAGVNYTRIQTPADLDNLNLDDYTVLYVNNYESDEWNQQYNDRLGTIENWVDAGGAYYMSSGTNNWGVAPTHPGGLVRTAQQYHQTGTTQLTQEECLLFDLMDWDQGTELQGNSWCHATYDEGAIGNIENTHGAQIMVRNTDDNVPTTLNYSYGRGFCVVSGSTDGFLHNAPDQYIWGQTGPALLQYLAAGSSAGLEWLTVNPESGSVAAGSEDQITLTYNSLDLANGDYFGNLVITSNDPNTPTLTLGVSMNVGEGRRLQFYTNPERWVETADNHSILVTDVTRDGQTVPTGWEVGVFTPAGVLCGAEIWVTGGEGVGMAAWGADEAHGNYFQAGQRMHFRMWDFEANAEYTAGATVAEGSLDWSNGGFTVMALASRSVTDITVGFTAGWNLYSVNVVPSQDMYVRQEGPDVRRMMNQFRVGQGHHIILMKNERGNFYSPAFRDFCNIPFWNLEEGYQVRMDQAIEGHWSGQAIAAGADVPIAAGWNMIAYFPAYDLPITRANGFYPISGIVDNVVLMKNGIGHFCAPRNRFSNMEPLTQGRGYQINVNANVTLNYPAAQNMAATIPADEALMVIGPWSEPVSTGNNMSVLLTSIDGAKNGDAVAAFDASGRLVGLGKLNDGMAGLAVWGDDPSTEAVDGLVKGEAFTLKLYSVETGMIVNLSTGTIASGAGLVYETDGFSALTASSIAIPSEYSLGQNYPNPFNMVTRLSFGLPEDAQVSIRVFDLAGRSVATLVSGELKAGTHSATWNAEGFTSGIYLVKMETPSFNATRKVTLVK